MIKLYPHQKAQMDFVLPFIHDKKNVLVQLPTGGGKTVLIGETLPHVKNYIILAHTTSLCAQLRERLGEEAAKHVYTFQTYLNIIKKKTTKHVETIIIDETHRVQAAGYQKIFKHHANAQRIGFSATPMRLDKGKIANKFYYIDDNTLTYKNPAVTCYGKCDGSFDVCICGVSVDYLIQNGFLADYKVYGFKYNRSSLKKIGGEFTSKSIEETVTPELLTEAVLHLARMEVRKPLIFLASIKHAHNFLEYYNKEPNKPYRILLCTSEDSDAANRALEQYRNTHQGIALVSCNMLNEGIDVPDADGEVLGRPTTSPTVLLQQLGRALRFYKDKIAILFDVCGNIETHGMPCEPRQWHVPEAPSDKKGDPPAVQCQSCFQAFHFSKIIKTIKVTTEIDRTPSGKIKGGVVLRTWNCIDERCNALNHLKPKELPSSDLQLLRDAEAPEVTELKSEGSASVTCKSIHNSPNGNLVTSWLFQSASISTSLIITFHKSYSHSYVTYVTDNGIHKILTAPIYKDKSLTQIAKILIDNKAQIIGTKKPVKSFHLRQIAGSTKIIDIQY